MVAVVESGLQWWPHKAESEKSGGTLGDEEGRGHRHREGSAFLPQILSLTLTFTWKVFLPEQKGIMQT